MNKFQYDKKGLLIVISGPSGAGKGTVCKALLKEVRNLNISVSMTTRKPRIGEIEGVNYYFVQENEFKKMIKEGELLEYAKVYDNYYGTPKNKVLEKLKHGEDVILEIDIQGALKVKSQFPEGVFIFIVPPSMEELKNRIKKRGTETEEEVTKRFQSSYKEINYISKYNYIVINDDIEKAVERIKSIIIAEKCRVDRLKHTVLKTIEGGI
ncbi:guanylate kinase [Garciella nitratireducens]|uniref:Guanylate kinase n=1 Tax=Garciella nitratireducens DSM 15102 TaxID=1121911 RepID=A0A1T4JZ66_9FIRM|nr:guanylate kinase [Garciella nitratireducens]RBP39181.1 guanylate kinase [Garciella nitratireducens]SJZ35542.1 guanylate kinase [Garciella nitratireducens DSM 15102]